VDDNQLANDSRIHMFGYSLEHVHMLLTPMLDEAEEGLGSMGNDAALACMSRQPRVIYEYFKQLFAQVCAFSDLFS
jgi:glutamate synthase (NADPH/NADH)